MEPQLYDLVVPGPVARHGGPRRMAWWEWNATGQAHPAHLIVCVHGLTRQARDFDVLARALAPHACVVCVDVAGRGHSDWLADPMAYQVPTYVSDLACLLAHVRQRHAAASAAANVGALQVDWVGTSMGGLIGMALAAQPAIGLRRLVLNDVGPVIEAQSLQRIAQYVGASPVYATPEDAVAALWGISSGFGPHTPEQWLALSRPMLRAVPGGWVWHYDPDIAVPFRAWAAAALQLPIQGNDVAQEALWQLYDAIATPTLLLRGQQSDLLSQATAQAMTQRGPRAQLREFAGVGHAPTLVAPDQVQAVTQFLLAP